MDLHSLFLKFHMFVCKPWMFFTSKVISWKHFFVSEWRFLHEFFGVADWSIFFQLRFFGFHQKNAEISILNGDFSIFFRLNKFSTFFFQLWFFRFHQKNEFLHFFGWKVLRSFVFNCEFSSFTRRSEKTCILNRFEFSFVQTTFPFGTKLEWNKNIILGISLFFGWRFLHFLTVNWIVHVFQENRTVSILKRGLAFSFHFQHFSAEKCTNPQSFFCRLLFAKKNWNKEAPCNTEKPPLRMETYPVLFWFVFLKFLRILLLHLESLMLIKKWNHNHSEQINIHSEWRHNFTKRMHQPACKMEKYRFWMGKSPCMFSFKFDQKEWNTTCSEPTTFIQHEDFSDSFSST